MKLREFKDLIEDYDDEDEVEVEVSRVTHEVTDVDTDHEGHVVIYVLEEG